MLEITSFGKSSTGKSALLNVLFATDFFKSDTHNNSGLQEQVVTFADQQVRLIDTPGIHYNDSKYIISKQAADHADLVLFVCDNTPSHQEYIALKQLITSGKPVLVILNKADTLPVAQRTQLLQQLHQHLISFVDAHNILTCAAQPNAEQAIDPYQNIGYVVTPDITHVKQRLTNIIQSEIPTLRHLKQLSDKTVHTVEDAKKIEYESKLICRDYALGTTASVVLNPFMWLDFTLIIIGLTLLIAELANNHKLMINKDDLTAIEHWMRVEGTQLLWPVALIFLLCIPLQFMTIISTLMQAFGAYQITKIIGHACTRCFTQRKNNITALHDAVQSLSQKTQRNTVSFRPTQFIERKLNHFSSVHVSSALH